MIKFICFMNNRKRFYLAIDASRLFQLTCGFFGSFDNKFHGFYFFRTFDPIFDKSHFSNVISYLFYAWASKRYIIHTSVNSWKLPRRYQMQFVRKYSYSIEEIDLNLRKKTNYCLTKSMPILNPCVKCLCVLRKHCGRSKLTNSGADICIDGE